MLNVPESIKRLYQTDGINKNFRVHFPNGENADLTNKDIVEGSVKFAESVSSKDVLKFGLSEQSKIEFECVGVQNIFGMTIECSNEIDTSSLTAEDIQTIQEDEWDGTLVLSTDSDINYGYFRIPLGTFRVESCPRSHGAMAHRRVVGYSGSFVDGIGKYNDIFNGVYPYGKMATDYYIFEYFMGMSSMETADASESDRATYRGPRTAIDQVYSEYYYDSNKNKYEIRFVDSCLRYIQVPSGDFCDVVIEGDLDRYKETGEAIISAIENAGWNVVYDNKGKKIYKDMRALLKERAPWIFYPAFSDTEFAHDAGEYNEFMIMGGGQVRNGLNALPYLYDNTYPKDRKGIYGISDTVDKALSKYQFSKGNKRIYTFRPEWNDTYTSVGTVILEKLNSQGEVVSVNTVEYNYNDYSCIVKSVRSYRIPNGGKRGDTFITNGALKTDGYAVYEGNSDVLLPKCKITNNVFENSLSVSEFTKAYLELRACFGRVDRNNAIVAQTLSKSNSVSLNPSDVEDLWWDEYDVEQIGTVRYNVADTQSIVEYQIGNGGSVYDFGDNYVIKRIFATYTEDNYIDAINLINSLIDRYFVPNVTDVPFVPVDMTMRGLPYVESGDYIVYDDGTDQVGTYVLNRAMDGVQTLFDDIESNGGEVMGK